MDIEHGDERELFPSSHEVMLEYKVRVRGFAESRKMICSGGIEREHAP